MNKTETLSIAGYSTIEYNNIVDNTIISQSNYPFSTGTEVVIVGWYDEYMMKSCSSVVAAWHVKGTKQLNNSPTV